MGEVSQEGGSPSPQNPGCCPVTHPSGLEKQKAMKTETQKEDTKTDLRESLLVSGRVARGSLSLEEAGSPGEVVSVGGWGAGRLLGEGTQLLCWLNRVVSCTTCCEGSLVFGPNGGPARRSRCRGHRSGVVVRRPGFSGSQGPRHLAPSGMPESSL